MGELGFCHFGNIASQVANQLGVDISVDTGWPIFLIRLLHNKAVDWAFFSLKCYFQYLSTEQIFSIVSVILLPYIIYAFSGDAWRKRLIFISLVMPIIFMFLLKSITIGIKVFAYQGFWIFLAVAGCVKMLKKN